MNRKPIIVIAALVAVGGTTAYLVRRAGAEARATTIYGNVDIRDVSLAFRVPGRVVDLKAEEGATVRQGEVLAALDGEPLQNSLAAAEATYAAISARNGLLHKGYRSEDVEQAKARLKAAQAALVETERVLARQKTLAPDGAASQRAVDAATSAHEQASAQVRAIEQQVRQMTSGFRPEEIAESDALVRQAKAALDSARLALKDATLVAPSDGVVLTRAVEKGSLVQAGTPAFSLSLTRPVWVRAYVNEPQLGRFATGTRVTLTSDSRPDKPYHGTIGFVSPTAEFTPKSVETADLRTSLVYRLRIVVDDADGLLKQGMPVTVRLAK